VELGKNKQTKHKELISLRKPHSKEQSQNPMSQYNPEPSS